MYTAAPRRRKTYMLYSSKGGKAAGNSTGSETDKVVLQEASILAQFGGNTSVSLEESRQRQMISRAEPKGKSANPLWSGDEAARPPPPANTTVLESSGALQKVLDAHVHCEV